MASLFTKIINKEIPAHIIYEDEAFIAFLDIMPVALGHTLLVPKNELSYIFEHSDEELSAAMKVAKKLAAALEKVVPCLKVGMAVIGLEVPHTHIHLVPLNAVEDINFAKKKEAASQEALSELAASIRQALS